MSRDLTYLKESGETDHMIGNGKFVLWGEKKDKSESGLICLTGKIFDIQIQV